MDREYEEATQLLSEFGAKLEVIIGDVATELGIAPQHVTHRVKSAESSSRKLKEKGDRYSSVSEFTDLLGVRVVTYLVDEVDLIADKLPDVFAIDLENSVDKRAALESDRFGYLSLHFVASLKEDRLALSEYSRFRGLKFELQLRSVLQHAWAEIEHDLGYKSEQGIPGPARRRFSRLSALLEVADDEFKRLRSDLSQYEASAKETVTAASTELDLDQATLTFAIGSRSDYAELDQRVGRALSRDLQASVIPSYVANRVTSLRAAGLTRLDDVTDLLTQGGGHIERFAQKWAERPNRTKPARTQPLPLGISVFYAEIVYRLAKGLPNNLTNPKPSTLDDLAETWSAVRGELGDLQLTPFGNASSG